MKTVAMSAQGAIAALTTIALSSAFTACATVTTTTPTGERLVRSHEEFSDYVEQVFRFQNRVGSDLITYYELSGDSSREPGADLMAAEERMVQSCRYLYEVVMAHIEGREPGLDLKMKLVDTITDCEYATRDLAHLIDDSGHAVVLESTTVP
ncbi:MAG: hypothetical protein ACT4NU_03915 [Chromatiales bacterium]